MSAIVLTCGKVFDGASDALTGPAEILAEGNRIAAIGPSVSRPPDARVIDLSDRTVSPGFIDMHVHLTMDAATIGQRLHVVDRELRHRDFRRRLHAREEDPGAVIEPPLVDAEPRSRRRSPSPDARRAPEPGDAFVEPRCPAFPLAEAAVRKAPVAWRLATDARCS